MTRSMPGRAIVLIWLTVAAVAPAPSARAQGAPMPDIPPGACDPSAPAAPGARPVLPHVAAALADGTLDILAVGSGSIANPRLRPDETFPARTVQVLRAERPGLDARVTVQAQRGEAATEMLSGLQRALAGHRFRLVLWQTGSVEELRGTPAADLARTLAEGADATHAAGADLVLIEPQYAAELTRVADPQAYRAAFDQAATRPDVVLLSRATLMQDGATTGRLDLEHVKEKDRHKTLILLHACIGRGVAAAVLDGARTAPAAAGSLP